MCAASHCDIQERDEKGRTCNQHKVSESPICLHSKKKNDVNDSLCPHIPMSRQDLFQVIKIKKLHTFRETIDIVGIGNNSQGCEICKPAIASILSSLYNEHVMKPQHHGSQDTNDRFLANIQRNGTFSVVPRIPGGEIHPEKLVAIGKIASEYKLYTKITGGMQDLKLGCGDGVADVTGQRIDMFGAQKADLPDIWTKLHEAGLESGKSATGRQAIE